MRLSQEKLETLTALLESKGYRKYNQKYNTSDYAFWKPFGLQRNELGDKSMQYQVGFLVYNFGVYPTHEGEPFSISFEFNLTDNSFADRADFSVSDREMTVEEFEFFCQELYEKMFAKTTLLKSLQ